MITLKKHEKWKVNESLRKVKSKMVDRALLCGASRGGVYVGGQKCEREQEEAGDSKRKDWREREVEQRRGRKVMTLTRVAT